MMSVSNRKNIIGLIDFEDKYLSILSECIDNFFLYEIKTGFLVIT